MEINTLKVFNSHTLNIIIILVVILLFDKLSKKNVKEGFINPAAISKVFSALVDFCTNIPTILAMMVDAMITFFLNFVDIFIALFSALEWIINIPGWVMEGFFYLIALILDLIVIMVTWLNPITMIKGVVKLILAMVKIILSFVIDTIIHLLRLLFNYIGGNLQTGLWGIPHGPDNHKAHRKIDGLERPIDDDDMGYGDHHHGASPHDGEKDPHLYSPLRCYKEIGANGFMNIIAIIICPPLGVFMAYGLSGWFKILICCCLTLFYYIPGLFYALLITTHLGIGNDLDFKDCGGRTGGYIIKGCGHRKTEEHCNEATIPKKKDINGKEIKACYWNPKNKKCRSLIYDGSFYEKLIIEKNTKDPSRTNIDTTTIDYNRFDDIDPGGVYSYREKPRILDKWAATANYKDAEDEGDNEN